MRIPWYLRVAWWFMHGRVKAWLEERALVLPRSEAERWARRLNVPVESVQLFWDQAVRHRILELWEGLR